MKNRYFICFVTTILFSCSLWASNNKRVADQPVEKNTVDKKSKTLAPESPSDYFKNIQKETEKNTVGKNILNIFNTWQCSCEKKDGTLSEDYMRWCTRFSFNSKTANESALIYEKDNVCRQPAEYGAYSAPFMNVLVQIYDTDLGKKKVTAEEKLEIKAQKALESVVSKRDFANEVLGPTLIRIEKKLAPVTKEQHKIPGNYVYFNKKIFFLPSEANKLSNEEVYRKINNIIPNATIPQNITIKEEEKIEYWKEVFAPSFNPFLLPYEDVSKSKETILYTLLSLNVWKKNDKAIIQKAVVNNHILPHILDPVIFTKHSKLLEYTMQHPSSTKKRGYYSIKIGSDNTKYSDSDKQFFNKEFEPWYTEEVKKLANFNSIKLIAACFDKNTPLLTVPVSNESTNKKAPIQKNIRKKNNKK